MTTSHDRSTIPPTGPDITTIQSPKNKTGPVPPHARDRRVPLRDRLAAGISLPLSRPQVGVHFQRRLPNSRGIHPGRVLRDRRRSRAHGRHRHLLLAIPHAPVA